MGRYQVHSKKILIVVKVNYDPPLPMLKEFLDGKTNVLYDLAQLYGRNVTALMKRNCSYSAVRVSKLLVRPTLANFLKTQ